MENISEIPVQENTTSSEKDGIPIWIQVVGHLFNVASIIYCIKSRTWEEFIKYGSYIVFGLLIVIFSVLIIGTIRSGFTRPNWEGLFLGVPLIILLLIYMGISNYSVFVVIKDTFLWLKSPTISKTSAVILTSLLSISVGWALFYFRLRMRAIYGLTEAAIGIVVAGNRVLTQIDQVASSDFYLAILTASVYLIVRGFDNIHQGLTKDPIDKRGAKVFNFLKMRL